MMQKYKVCPDAIIRQHGSQWVFSNPRVYSHVVISADTAACLMATQKATAKEWADKVAQLSAQDATGFTNAQGLMADPTGFEAPQKRVAGDELFELLKKRWVLCLEDESDYKEFLQHKTSVMDRSHLGSFHQNVGQHQLMTLRTKESWKWWHEQKFSSDGLSLKPGYYQAIQGQFIHKWIAGEDFCDKSLLDFACGNGYYSRLFANAGAKVTGVDTSSDLIELAQKNHGDAVNFIQPEDEAACAHVLKEMPTHSFDVIYLSDALLFFFYDLKDAKHRSQGVDSLLSEFRRLLKPGGCFYLMEPNGVFWLAPWYGEPNLVSTTVCEYRSRLYHVAPTFDQVMQAASSAGFLLQSFEHPNIDSSVEGIDALSLSFAKEFPLWDFYRFV